MILRIGNYVIRKHASCVAVFCDDEPVAEVATIDSALEVVTEHGAYSGDYRLTDVADEYVAPDIDDDGYSDEDLPACMGWGPTYHR